MEHILGVGIIVFPLPCQLPIHVFICILVCLLYMVRMRTSIAVFIFIIDPVRRRPQNQLQFCLWPELKQQLERTFPRTTISVISENEK